MDPGTTTAPAAGAPAADGPAPSAGSAAARRVARNSLWLIAQPLLLNAISIFATAYIARSLGPEDYGRFVFAFAFISLFMPFTNLGLRLITMRDLATSDRSGASDYIGRISTLRLALAVVAAGVCVLAAALGRASPDTARAVYLATAIIVLQAVTSAATDVFQAYEDMRLVARVQLVSGLLLTVGSVLALAAGLGLDGLLAAYVLGNLAGAALALRYLYTRFAAPRLAVDLPFWWRSLVRAAPLFVPSLVLQAGMRLGIVGLAAMAGQAAVGSFGAAATLTERLGIIPDGVCTALFPALANVYGRSREEAGVLFRRVYRYFLLLALPLAVGTTVLAEPIIRVMYGARYGSSAPVLVLLAWALFASFFAQLLGWSVGAIGQERKGFWVPVVATVAYLLAGAALMPALGELGLAVASLVLPAVAFALNGVIVRRHLSATSITRRDLVRAVLASAIMGALTWLVRGWPVYLSIPLGAAIYAGALLAVRAIEPAELSDIRDTFRGRLPGAPHGA